MKVKIATLCPLLVVLCAMVASCVVDDEPVVSQDGINASTEFPRIFDTCSAEQREFILETRAEARGMAYNAWQYIAALRDTFGRGGRILDIKYQTWFGEYSDYRALLAEIRAAGIFFRISNPRQDVKYDCESPNGFKTCLNDSSVQAFVTPTINIVRYCDRFFNQRLRKAASIVYHEISHLDSTFQDEVGRHNGTDDLSKTESGALSLARTNPNQAFQNSYNWQYFSLEFSGDIP